MTIEQIKELVIKFPNDMQLGEAVRRLYWLDKKTTSADANQLDLFEDEDRDNVQFWEKINDRRY